jgi:hypothetical protein
MNDVTTGDMEHLRIVSHNHQHVGRDIVTGLRVF